MVSLPAAQFGIKFEHAAGQEQRFLPQILRRIVLVAENLHNVPGFQNRSDAVAYRFGTVGNDRVNFNGKHIADILYQFTQAHGFVGVLNARFRTDGNVDNQMRNARRKFDGKNRRGNMFLLSNTYLAFDGRNHFVGAGDVQRIVTGDGAAVFPNQFL